MVGKTGSIGIGTIINTGSSNGTGASTPINVPVNDLILAGTNTYNCPKPAKDVLVIRNRLPGINGPDFTFAPNTTAVTFTPALNPTDYILVIPFY